MESRQVVRFRAWNPDKEIGFEPGIQASCLVWSMEPRQGDRFGAWNPGKDLGSDKDKELGLEHRIQTRS